MQNAPLPAANDPNLAVKCAMALVLLAGLAAPAGAVGQAVADLIGARDAEVIHVQGNAAAPNCGPAFDSTGTFCR